VAHPWHHAVSSARKHGGAAEDYLAVHEWFDASKEHHGDFRHRALRHHTAGVFECERAFGVTLTNSDGRRIPVRWIAEQHVVEDLGFVPSPTQWLAAIEPEPWMTRSRRLSRRLEEASR
jgi:Domain of unknown function (DUF6915)